MNTSNQQQPIETTWEILTYDVWGNAEDGYEVNNTFRSGETQIDAVCEVNNPGTPNEFISAHLTDEQIKEALDIRAEVAIDVDGDDLTYYVNMEKDGYPLGELRCVSHKSLSPIIAAK